MSTTSSSQDPGAAPGRQGARRATPYFIFGCQRSGTTIAAEAFGRCPAIEVYEEMDPRATEVRLQCPPFQDSRLRGPSEIERLIAACTRPVVMFKPLMESQFADLILQRHGGHGLWFFRHYADVANSAVEQWGPHQWELCYDIRHGQWARRGWRIERMSSATIGLINTLWRQDLSPHEGAALFWYTRNILLYELGLERSQNITLVPYESLVAEPRAWFGKIFAKMGIQLTDHYIGEIKPTSVGKKPRPKLASSIQSLCDELLDRMSTDSARGSAAPNRSDAPADSA